MKKNKEKLLEELYLEDIRKAVDYINYKDFVKHLLHAIELYAMGIRYKDIK